MRWAMTRLDMHASQVKFSNSVNIMATVIVFCFVVCLFFVSIYWKITQCCPPL